MFVLARHACLISRLFQAENVPTKKGGKRFLFFVVTFLFSVFPNAERERGLWFGMLSGPSVWPVPSHNVRLEFFLFPFSLLLLT